MNKFLLKTVNYLLLTIFAFGLIYLSLIVYLLKHESDFIFVGQNGHAVTKNIPETFSEKIEQNDIGNIEYYTNDIKNYKNVVFYFPGNNENASYFLNDLAKLFPESKIYSLNYPNYGKSSYELTQKNIDISSLEFANLHSEGKDVIVVGRSVGTGFASFVAANIPNLKKLILITPYSQFDRLACDIYSFIPDAVCQKYMTFKMDNIDNLYKIKDQKKIVIVYSENDEVILFENFSRLKNKFNDINYLNYPKANHNNITEYFLEDPEFKKNLPKS